MTFSLHAFSSSDTPFDVQAAALEDPRPIRRKTPWLSSDTR